ncbi:MAG: hypothetical protein VW257_12305, partial [Quisquiliibacterium sp.]
MYRILVIGLAVIGISALGWWGYHSQRTAPRAPIPIAQKAGSPSAAPTARPADGASRSATGGPAGGAARDRPVGVE